MRALECIGLLIDAYIHTCTLSLSIYIYVYVCIHISYVCMYVCSLRLFHQSVEARVEAGHRGLERARRWTCSRAREAALLLRDGMLSPPGNRRGVVNKGLRLLKMARNRQSYIHTYIYIYIYDVYTYIYIERERESEQATGVPHAYENAPP